ncbi:MAG: DNA-processing protein DprA [Phycisphaerae bacterium]|nr:DNA-processing protein DprA [Phycisphaerae bacterium]
MSDVQTVRSYLRLTLADGIGTKTFHRLVEAFGDAAAAGEAGPVAWRGLKGIGPKAIAALQAVTDETIDEELAEARRLGAEILCLEDEAYPAALKNIFDPPPVLYVRGRLEPNDASAVGVVGSRRCTHYGMEQADRFGGLLGRAGMTVVSGGARGIDTAAHRGTLAAGGRTLAVMGCGLGHTYPPENEKLFEQIVAEDRGALISELPVRTAVLSGNFPTRNRIISGMSLGTLVVEAAVPSGALITARVAAEQGREVFAMPGRVDSPLSAGTNQLLRDGAHLAADLDDILGPLGEAGAAFSESPADAVELPAPAGLTEIEQKLYDALAIGALSMDDLIRRTEQETGPAAAAMTMLVLKGAVAQKPGNVFARKRG